VCHKSTDSNPMHFFPFKLPRAELELRNWVGQSFVFITTSHSWLSKKQTTPVLSSNLNVSNFVYNLNKGVRFVLFYQFIFNRFSMVSYEIISPSAVDKVQIRLNLLYRLLLLHKLTQRTRIFKFPFF
jgi:hypothetical protein